MPYSIKGAWIKSKLAKKMPLVKHTVYIDNYMDSCIREIQSILVKRKVKDASYPLAANLMLAVNILDIANGKGYSRIARERIQQHIRDAGKGPIDDRSVS